MGSIDQSDIKTLLGLVKWVRLLKDANTRWKKATKGGNEFCLNLILTKGMLIGSKRVEEGGSINESASWRKELEDRVRRQKGWLSRSIR